MQLTPFTGATVEFRPTEGPRRQYVFGYVFVAPPFDDLFGGVGAYDVSSGQTQVSAPVALP